MLVTEQATQPSLAVETDIREKPMRQLISLAEQYRPDLVDQLIHYAVLCEMAREDQEPEGTAA